MKQKKVTTAEKSTSPSRTAEPMFTRENIIWMIAGAVIIAIGFLLMAGGRSEDPNVFNENEVYSTRRITIAPIVILVGIVVEIFAIFRNPKK